MSDLEKFVDTPSKDAEINLSAIRSRENEESLVELRDWRELYADRDFNIRGNTDKNYSESALKWLSDNLRLIGQTEAIMVSLQSDGRLKILRGHLRHAAMSFDVAKFEAALVLGKASESDRPWTKVKVDIKRGLSKEDEILLMLDHGSRQELTPTEMYRAVKALADLKWTEKQVERHLRTTRGKITVHYRAATMPKVIQEGYQKGLAGEDGFKVVAEDINALHKARNTDKRTKKVAMGGGPAFKAKLEQVKESATNPVERFSVKKFVERARDDAADEANGHALLFDLFSHCLGEGTSIWTHVYENVVKALVAMFPPTPAESEDETPADPPVKTIERDIVKPKPNGKGKGK